MGHCVSGLDMSDLCCHWSICVCQCEWVLRVSTMLACRLHCIRLVQTCVQMPACCHSLLSLQLQQLESSWCSLTLRWHKCACLRGFGAVGFADTSPRMVGSAATRAPSSVRRGWTLAMVLSSSRI